MTWQELADFINNDMPKWERDQYISVFDNSINNYTGGNCFTVSSIAWYDPTAGPKDKDNFHSLDINTEEWW